MDEFDSKLVEFITHCRRFSSSNGCLPFSTFSLMVPFYASTTFVHLSSSEFWCGNLSVTSDSLILVYTQFFLSDLLDVATMESSSSPDTFLMFFFLSSFLVRALTCLIFDTTFNQRFASLFSVLLGKPSKDFQWNFHLLSNITISDVFFSTIVDGNFSALCAAIQRHPWADHHHHHQCTLCNSSCANKAGE